MKTLEDSLRQTYPEEKIRPLIEPFLALAADRDFWNRTLDGLAVLAAPGLFQVYRLLRPVPELAVAADSFHTKPLLRILQSADRYQVLGLSRKEIKLFEGNRDALDPIELAEEVPRTITEALGEELTEPHLGVSGSGPAGPATYHGLGGKKDELDIDAERFFRVVDRAVLEHHSRPSGLPLLLAALPEHHHLFRQVSHNPFLLAQGIDVHPDAVSADELRERAWRTVEPYYLARLAELVEAFGAARAKGMGADDPVRVAEAAVAGQVATLLIDADSEIPGRIDSVTGRVSFDDLVHPEVDDLLDDLAEWVMKTGGQVVVVPSERMPTETGVAAIYRY
ncbi:baeRF3 domain-containing protein [Methylocaldum sp. MU1018]